MLDPPSETEVSTDTSQAVPLMLVTAYQDDKQRMSDKSLPNVSMLSLPNFALCLRLDILFWSILKYFVSLESQEILDFSSFKF